MRTLSEKLDLFKTTNDLSFRKLGKIIGISHSTIHKIIKEEKTALKPKIKKKLINFLSEVSVDDFTEIKIKSTSQSKGNINIRRLLKKYDSKKSMRTEELRQQYYL